MNYNKIAYEIMSLVGGKGNVLNVIHCATRLRISIGDMYKINNMEVNNINGVLAVIERGNELHFVIGEDVAEVFREFIRIGE